MLPHGFDVIPCRLQSFTVLKLGLNRRYTILLVLLNINEISSGLRPFNIFIHFNGVVHVRSVQTELLLPLLVVGLNKRDILLTFVPVNLRLGLVIRRVYLRLALSILEVEMVVDPPSFICLRRGPIELLPNLAELKII